MFAGRPGAAYRPIMRLRDMRKIVRLRSVEPDAARRRLSACHDIADLRRVAKRRIPRPVFDYVDGAADEERTATANVEAFRLWRFQPRVLADVSEVDTSASLFGSPLPVPLVLAPTGYTRMMHSDGERGAARAAARAGIPYTLSTMATTGIEELRDAVAEDPAVDPALWFQLYVLKDRGRAYDLVDRAWSAGFRVLVVTVDTVIAGNRLRDTRNGLTMPPSLTPSTVASVAAKPGYWLQLLSGPALEYANFAGQSGTAMHQSAMFFDPAIDWSDIEALRSRWPGRIVVKGPLGPADARHAIDLGVDGIQLSNHGGRQLDRCVPTADLIAPAREAVGPSVPILVDSGIRSGVDVAVALALGADAAALGRAYVYGLMAGGEAGVDRVLLIVERELRTTMRLLGVTSVADLRKRGSELITR
jgi:L-lactate dehydrogenase (cytochrome)